MTPEDIFNDERDEAFAVAALITPDMPIPKAAEIYRQIMFNYCSRDALVAAVGTARADRIIMSLNGYSATYPGSKGRDR